MLLPVLESGLAGFFFLGLAAGAVVVEELPAVELVEPLVVVVVEVVVVVVVELPAAVVPAFPPVVFAVTGGLWNVVMVS